MIPKRLVVTACACVVAAMLWPAPTAAQPRSGYHGHSHTSVSVGVGFGYGYRPYYPFYSPFYPFYSFGLGWGYPYYGWGAPYYGYPYGGYYNAWPSARLEIKPRTAQVFVDGYYVGLVDQFDGVFQRLDVPVGAHELAVYLPGYKSYNQKVLFRPGEGYNFKAILEPLPAGVTEDAPHPSANAPDPYAAPAPPYGRGEDPNGPPPPYEPGRTLPLTEQRPRSIDMQPQAGGFGTLNIRVQPADAVVIVDGEKWDSPEGGSRLSIQLAAGSHRVEVRKDGFKPYTSTVQVHPGEPQSLNISLPGGGE